MIFLTESKVLYPSTYFYFFITYMNIKHGDKVENKKQLTEIVLYIILVIFLIQVVLYFVF